MTNYKYVTCLWQGKEGQGMSVDWFKRTFPGIPSTDMALAEVDFYRAEKAADGYMIGKSGVSAAEAVFSAPLLLPDVDAEIARATRKEGDDEQ